MRYVSTRGSAPVLGFGDTLLAGLADDGGLYVPESWPLLADGGQGDYVETAVRMAQDRPRLAALRASLRARMQASPLLDAVGFTRKVETAFRGMWVDWCERQAKAR